MHTEKRGFLNDNYRLFYLRDQSDATFDFHSHAFHKLIVFIQGDVEYNIEGINYTLEPWDVLLISDTDIHRPVISPRVEYERLILWIHEETLNQISYGNDFLGKCFEQTKNHKNPLLKCDPLMLNALHKLTDHIKATFHSSDFGNDALQHALVIQLLVLINRSILSVAKPIASLNQRGDRRIHQVLDHINAHLHEDLTIETLAQKCYLSRYYLMHQFKCQTGFTLHHYIQKKRLDLANQLIRQGQTFTEAAYTVGFKEYSSFLRAYKKQFGQSPRAYHVHSQSQMGEAPLRQE